MAQHRALRRPHRAAHPTQRLKRRKAQKHSSQLVSSAVQHAEQPSATACTQQEVLERFHASAGGGSEDFPPGKPTEVLASAPAAVQPATEVSPLRKQPTPLSGARGPSAVTPAPTQLPSTQQLSLAYPKISYSDTRWLSRKEREPLLSSQRQPPAAPRLAGRTIQKSWFLEKGLFPHAMGSGNALWGFL
ncbi:hypothetical protein Efla_006002 [Eimeria flavescens]